MLTDGDYELISLYYGTDVTEEQAEKLAAEVEELNDEWEVETFYGGQPLYPILWQWSDEYAYKSGINQPVARAWL